MFKKKKKNFILKFRFLNNKLYYKISKKKLYYKIWKYKLYYNIRKYKLYYKIRKYKLYYKTTLRLNKHPTSWTTLEGRNFKCKVI